MSETITRRRYYCQKYDELSMKLCHKSPDNDDDWDELEDPCMDCGWRRPLEVEMSVFKVKCIKDWKYIKDLYTARVGEMVDAYVDQDRLVVGGRYISMDEFKEHFEICLRQLEI